MSSPASLPARALIASDQGLKTSFNLHYLLKTLLPNSVTLEIRALTYEFGGWG